MKTVKRMSPAIEAKKKSSMRLRMRSDVLAAIFHPPIADSKLGHHYDSSQFEKLIQTMVPANQTCVKSDARMSRPPATNAGWRRRYRTVSTTMQAKTMRLRVVDAWIDQ